MNLILITSKYPFDKGEEFLETEMKYLSSNFKHIFIIPVKIKNHSIQTRVLPENVSIIDIEIRKTNFIHKAINNIRYIKVLVYGIIKEKAYRSDKLRNLIYIIHNSASLNYNLNNIQKQFSNSSFTIYSYWFSSILLGIFFSNEFVKSVTRLHGGDLYEDRNQIVFRRYLYKKIYYLCPISQHGKEYLNSRYNFNAEKVQIHRLGVEDLGEVDPSQNQYFTIISCSYLVGVKRVNLIIDALSRFEKGIKVQWIHIGTGPLFEELSENARNKLQCPFEFLGYIPNNQLANVYKKYNPNLFINCSASEGIPVSMMEAISFGVPILATNVGGVSEIVNEQTGFLLDKDISDEDIYNSLKQIIEQKLAAKKRTSAKVFYRSNFSAKKNYTDFINNILLS